MEVYGASQRSTGSMHCDIGIIRQEGWARPVMGPGARRLTAAAADTDGGPSWAAWSALLTPCPRRPAVGGSGLRASREGGEVTCYVWSPRHGAPQAVGPQRLVPAFPLAGEVSGGGGGCTVVAFHCPSGAAGLPGSE
ncbi:unnamed protein product [Rangifer tarandus platyrhynchus]|uniref:Uncharacterized protein n=2 Tax=Rangifer tarandus platyrhynchus TaxID=3082113 RepID=A0ACB0E4I6_RANTA|nr:unnamed protein product [Rangifer tarandus platyrhynchus]CAI9695435.1 unnamed protein product [Rangifer tarandus platyrhynchus]